MDFHEDVGRVNWIYHNISLYCHKVCDKTDKVFGQRANAHRRGKFLPRYFLLLLVGWEKFDAPARRFLPVVQLAKEINGRKKTNKKEREKKNQQQKIIFRSHTASVKISSYPRVAASGNANNNLEPLLSAGLSKRFRECVVIVESTRTTDRSAPTVVFVDVSLATISCGQLSRSLFRSPVDRPSRASRPTGRDGDARVVGDVVTCAIAWPPLRYRARAFRRRRRRRRCRRCYRPRPRRGRRE